MLEVADCDLENYMDLVDDMEMGDKRRKLSEPMMRWPGCLIQAIDYLHEMRIKHKDLKPANILVKDGQVIITDFGIAKDLIDEDTTRSLKMNGLQGTPTYMAPEISAGTHRRRAVDIFALGCVFLEIATILLIGPGSLKRFAKFRETGNSRAYASCPLKLSQWIWHLRTYTHCCFRDFADLKPDYILRTEMTSVAYRLAFLMLDPNPQTRITARQMVTLIHSKIFARNLTIKSYACEHCVNGQTIEQSNLPLHSVFMPQVYLKYPDSPESALEQSLGESWEEVKTFWLESHMWWDQEKQLQLKRRRLEQRQQEQLQREQLQQEQYRLEQLQLERLMIFRREEQRIREKNPLIPHQRAYAYERERLRLQEEPHP
jgi:serine/threonine protein kinase